MITIQIANDKPGGIQVFYKGKLIKDIKHLKLAAAYDDFTQALVTFVLRDKEGNLITEEIDGELYVAEAKMDLFDYITEHIERGG